MRQQFDYLVLGSGIAGLSFALQAARHGSVALLAKRGRSETNTAYAQGGIAAVFGPQDSFEQHIHDTLEAGAGLCRDEAVRVTVTEGPARVRELIELGAEFTRDASEFGYHLTREGGHSQRRVVHAADLTGMEVERTLLDAAACRVQFSKNTTPSSDPPPSRLEAPAGVLGAPRPRDRTSGAPCGQSGGAGDRRRQQGLSLHLQSRRGDGRQPVAAHRAGAAIADHSSSRFHPPASTIRRRRASLISEALRGGAASCATARAVAGPRPAQGSRLAIARGIDSELKRRGDGVAAT
jgi:L-aspartate oxidase